MVEEFEISSLTDEELENDLKDITAEKSRRKRGGDLYQCEHCSNWLFHDKVEALSVCPVCGGTECYHRREFDG